MEVSFKQSTNEISFSLAPTEHKALRKYYASDGDLVQAVHNYLRTWVETRLKQKNEDDMRYLADKFGKLSTDRQLEIMRILDGTNG